MRAFANFLLSKRKKSLPNGAEFVYREIVGGLAHLVQTKLPTSKGGGDVPGFQVQISGEGLYSTTANGLGFILNTDHSAFDNDFADFLSVINAEVRDIPVFSDPPTQSELSSAVDSVEYLNNALVPLKNIMGGWVVLSG